MKKIALITGISGQDGAYLAKFFLVKLYSNIDRRSMRMINGIKKVWNRKQNYN